MPRARGRAFDLTQKADYDAIIRAHPWIVEHDRDCVLSPDGDGLLCGLLMSHYLGWKIRGFYDGKAAVIQKGYSARDCVFLDMEIYRAGVRSVGHHMLLVNKKHKPADWPNYAECISPNLLRDYDGAHDFSTKYPFGTIHLLLPIVNACRQMTLPKSALVPLLWADGTYRNLFPYMENCLDWIRYLGATQPESILHPLFLNEHYALYSFMQDMHSFFERRDKMSVKGQRGDRIAITTRGGDGSPKNVAETSGIYYYQEPAKARGDDFISLLAELTGWEYKRSDWTWTGWQLYEFSKDSFKSSGKRVNLTNFDALLAQHPLSWAMTDASNIEFTLEYPDALP